MRTELLALAALLEYALARGSNALSRKVMQRLEDERIWGPLSENYPNLMGVTDEDIEKYKERISDEYDKKFDEYVKNYGFGPIGDRYKDVIVNDYFKFVRVLNRQQIFEIARELGKQLEDKIGSLQSANTIYITSPRGGYEFLSIFAYANDLPKSLIPSDIREWRFTGKKFGANWFMEFSGGIENVVIVDDIIASSEQMRVLYRSVKETFQYGVNTEAVVIAKREWPWRIRSIQEEQIERAKKIHDSVIYGIETIGIPQWRKKFDLNNPPDPEKDIITVGFPWSIPDGKSDVYLNELYGSRSYRGRGRQGGLKKFVY